MTHCHEYQRRLKSQLKKSKKKRDPIIKALNEYEFFYWGEPADSSTYNDLVRRINEQKEDVAELNKKIELMSSLKIKSMDDAIKHVVPIYTSTIGECMEPCKDLNKKLEGTLTDLVTYVKNPASPLREIVSDQKYRALKEV